MWRKFFTEFSCWTELIKSLLNLAGTVNWCIGHWKSISRYIEWWMDYVHRSRDVNFPINFAGNLILSAVTWSHFSPKFNVEPDSTKISGEPEFVHKTREVKIKNKYKIYWDNCRRIHLSMRPSQKASTCLTRRQLPPPPSRPKHPACPDEINVLQRTKATCSWQIKHKNPYTVKTLYKKTKPRK